MTALLGHRVPRWGDDSIGFVGDPVSGWGDAK